MVNLFLTRVSRQLTGGRSVFITNDGGTTDYPHTQKNELDPFFTKYTNIN